jgi:outer membrane receptor protein involved in Fe transport
MINIQSSLLRSLPIRHTAIMLLNLLSLCGYSQSQKGILKGRVIDGSTHRALYNVSVSSDTSGKNISSSAIDGLYLLNLPKGSHTVSYQLEGFQNKTISQINIRANQITYADIILYPLTQNIAGTKFCKDSVPATDSVFNTTFKKETESIRYNFSNLNNDIISAASIRPGTDKNALLLVKRLNGEVTGYEGAGPLNNSFILNGMGERYNQLLLNGSPFSAFGALGMSYPLQLLPAEATEEASLTKTGDATIPAGYAGATVEIKTKDYTDNNFFYIQAGSGFTQGTNGQNFYGDARSKLEFLGLSGQQRSMPSGFPTTKSQLPYSSVNLQQQVYLNKQLNNNLAPVNFGSSKPDTRFLIGFGKNYKLKSGAKISITGFINQTKNEQFNETTVQAAPNVAENPYPFTVPDKSVVFAQSKDSNYNYASQLAGIINASIIFRKNKISFRNFLGSQFSNTYSKRTGIYKPDEDTLAHTAISYLTTQRYFVNTQLAGEHGLNANGKFKLSWQATYTFINEQNPDERNFLLRKGVVQNNTFEIATPIAAGSFTNTGRQWRSFKDNNFTGSFNLSFPLNLFHQPQVLSGGIYIQQNYRIFNSDILQVKGNGYVALDKLLAQERYYPGGVSIAAFYVNGYENPTRIPQSYGANYSASANLGASYLQLNGRLTNKVLLQLGSRVESASQLVSSIYYRYFTGFRNPQFFPLDENTRITTYNFLPSVNAVFSPFNKIKINAAYFKTLNRPQLQELTKYAYYNAQTFTIKTGNPLLAATPVTNFTGGINFLANAFSVIRVNAFYKKIEQPIEYIASNSGKGTVLFTPHNTPPATVKGLEAAIKLNLHFVNVNWLNGLTVFANGNITTSKAEAGAIRSLEIPYVSEHALSGTPDYAFNGGIVLQQQGLLPGLTVLYSRTGGYISALGSGKTYTLANGNTILAVPGYRVKGREQLDIQLSQKILQSKIEIIAGVNNLTASPFITYQDLNGNKKMDAPLVLNNNGNNGGGYFVSGVDNTITNIKQQPLYYITLSYLFK